MEKILALFLISILSSFKVMAGNGFVKGTVEYIRVHDTQNLNWKPPIFWLTLNGVTSAGQCKTWAGNVLFVMDSEAALSLALSAYMSGKEVAIRYDDEKLNSENHWCKAQYITLGEPAPLH